MGVSVFLEILNKPTITDVLRELTVFVAPLWLALIVGVLVGWTWRPEWATLRREVSQRPDSSWCCGVIPGLNSLKSRFNGPVPWIADRGALNRPHGHANDSSCSSPSTIEKEKLNLVTGEDLDHLRRLVEVRDGGPTWIQMMNRSTATMSYQAWRRDPQSGPPQYRSSTVFEDADPELVRDFFWDDEFRLKWDDMLVDSETLEECKTTGTMLVRWLRKFPFFCSDREYVIGRRIWKSERTYYCITKGVPCPSVPRRKTPRRVDLYYSSWCIRPVESRTGDGKVTACEILLFHHEDMGIPWALAKLGVRQGMWGAVKKIDPGLRTYQRHRASGAALSRCALLAQINSKVDQHRLMNSMASASVEPENSDGARKPLGNVQRVLIIGGAIALGCTLDRGILSTPVILGVARRFANIGRRL